MSDTLHNIKRFKGLKDKTWGRLQEMHQQVMHEKAEIGVMKGRQAKANLQRQRRLKEIETERKIDMLILETSKTSALRAVNLSQLLKKKWTEDANAYRIMSNIKDDKMERRVKYLLNDSIF